MLDNILCMLTFIILNRKKETHSLLFIRIQIANADVVKSAKIYLLIKSKAYFLIKIVENSKKGILQKYYRIINLFFKHSAIPFLD